MSARQTCAQCRCAAGITVFQMVFAVTRSIVGDRGYGVDGPGPSLFDGAAPAADDRVLLPGHTGGWTRTGRRRVGSRCPKEAAEVPSRPSNHAHSWLPT